MPSDEDPLQEITVERTHSRGIPKRCKGYRGGNGQVEKPRDCARAEGDVRWRRLRRRAIILTPDDQISKYPIRVIW